MSFIFFCHLSFPTEGDIRFSNQDTILFSESQYINELENEFYIIPLGENCNISGILSAFGLKKASYPYEWCISPFDGLYNSLASDFCDYTNPDYFTIYYNNLCPCNKYRIALAHDFPRISIGRDENGKEQFVLDPLWLNNIEMVQSKYDRRIARFHRACFSGKRVYFIRYNGINEMQARQLASLISLLYPKLDFLFVCVVTSSKNLGNWNIPKVKNFYENAPNGESSVSEWERIFKEINIPIKKREQ